MAHDDNTAAPSAPQDCEAPGAAPVQATSGPEVAGLLDQAYDELREAALIEELEPVRTAYGSLGECLLKLRRESAFLAGRPELAALAVLLEEYATHLDHAGAAALRAIAPAQVSP
jgi:hypothetical protein